MLNQLIERYPVLSECKEDIENVKNAMISCFKNGGKLLVCGNGGSCSDSDHIVGELMKGFMSKRPISQQKKAEMKANCSEVSDEWLEQLQCGLPAISLPSLTGLNSAFCNDVNPELMFAQSLMGLGVKGDILLCLSTSGNSKNVYAAAVVGKSLGLTVIALTGKTGGRLKGMADLCICVPETETFKVQELHLPTYHYLCAAVEKEFF